MGIVLGIVIGLLSAVAWRKRTRDGGRPAVWLAALAGLCIGASSLGGRLMDGIGALLGWTGDGFTAALIVF